MCHSITSQLVVIVVDTGLCPFTQRWWLKLISNSSTIEYFLNYTLNLFVWFQVNVKPLITHRFTLDQTLDAFETARTGAGGAIKVGEGSTCCLKSGPAIGQFSTIQRSHWLKQTTNLLFYSGYDQMLDEASWFRHNGQLSIIIIV